MNDITVSNVVVCDDVRREVTAKDILIGVYTAGIKVSSLPAQINLSVWMEVVPKASGNIGVEIRLEMPGNQPPAQARIDAQVITADESFPMFIPQAPYLILQGGDIKVSVRVAGHDRWKMIKKLKVLYEPPSFPAPSALRGEQQSP